MPKTSRRKRTKSSHSRGDGSQPTTAAPLERTAAPDGERAVELSDARTVVVNGQVIGPEGASFAAHRVVLSFRTLLPLESDSSAPPTTHRRSATQPSVASSATATVTADGSFSILVPDLATIVDPVEIAVVAPTGVELVRRSISRAFLAHPLRVRATPLPTFAVRPSEDPTLGRNVRVTGRVIDERGRSVPPGLPIVVWGVPPPAPDAPADAPEPPAQALLLTDTQNGGYFGGDWPSALLARALGTVRGGLPVPIPLTGGRLPTRIILVISLPDDLPDHDCACSDVAPQLPHTTDLTANPSAFSQDLGGRCVRLTTPNRVLEEFAYFFVVRTSEPEIKGVTLDDRRPLPPIVVDALLTAATTATATTAARLAVAPKTIALDAATVRELVRTDDAPTLGAVEDAAYRAEVQAVKGLLDGFLRQTPGRTVLDASHAVDWDDTPTIYQATGVAHGHILQYREVWRADGYSLGDLLYSLPLAPGQKRQVAILDWERRAESARAEVLEAEEQLDAILSRDRDVTEIVGSRLNEESSGGSRSTTWGVAGGIGAGLITGAFGIFGGVAGGGGGSSATSWQDNSRTLSASTLQQLRDRTTQRASAVRDTRSTVVQTVAQGETVRAETEAVANYNHCHAMTIEYFEVLRHFLVTHELADVRQCLFVPLPITRFDRAKALRWREPLRQFLRDRSLLAGFDAAERVQRNWAGWDVPDSRFSEEAPEALEGELRISFLLPRPRDGKDAEFQVDMWRPYRGLLNVDALELWTAKLNAKEQAERDRVFRTEVAPRIAERLVQRLRFAYVTGTGAEIGVSLDATLVSRYQESTPLYVTIRPAGALTALAREEIARFKIWYDPGGSNPQDQPLPPDARIIVHSGKMRYRTPHLEHLLFNEPRLLNDLGATDAVVVATPLSPRELRNPRREDEQLTDRLVKHLNAHLEYYHQAIWAVMDPNRRYMLLDGVLAPNADGRSVASVVENRLIGIVGNCLVLPLAPGNHLDPTVAAPDPEENGRGPVDLANLYASPPAPPTRISVPTRGVYAEAVMGECTSCERSDDTRFWRWDESPISDTPPAIQPLSTESRATGEPDLKPTPLPQPIVNIQQAPELPDPLGLRQALGVLAKANMFPDITGLAGSQKNALAAFKSSLDVAKTLGGEAATLAKQNEMSRTTDRTMQQISQAEKDELLTHDEAQSLAEAALGGLVGEPSTADRPPAPTKDPHVEQAIDAAAAADQGAISISTPTERLEARFDGPATALGSALPSTKFDPQIWDLRVPFIDDWPAPDTQDHDKITYKRWRTTRRRSKLEKFFTPAIPDPADPTVFQEAHIAKVLFDGGLLKAQSPGSDMFVVPTHARIAYPEDPAKPGSIDGSGKLPLVVLLHGNHPAWDINWAPATSSVTRTNASTGATETVFIFDTATSIDIVPNEEGYGYLQEELAKQGIISMSVDSNFANTLDTAIDSRAETVLLALDRLRELCLDPKSIYHGRIDFNNIGLFGHSRGGDAVVRVVKLNATRSKKYGIKTVCSVSPTDFTGTVEKGGPMVLGANEVKFYLVLYGTNDGDVSGLGGALAGTGTGFRLYARANCPKAMLQLSRCCHNRFNTVWSGPVPFHATGDDFGLPASEIPTLRSFDQHQTLIKEYASSLFVWQLKGGPSALPLYDGVQANTLGAEVSVQYAAGSKVKVIDDFEGNKSNVGGARTPGVGGVIPVTDVQVDAQTLDPAAAPHTLASITEHATHPTKVLRADVKTAPPAGTIAMTFDIPAAHRDWSTFASLTVGLSGTYEVTTAIGLGAGANPKVLLTVTDNDGTSAGLPTPITSTPAFHMVNVADPGDPEDLRSAVLFRFETVGIPLLLLSLGGVDMSKVARLDVEIDKAIATHVLVDSITLIAF